MEEINENEIQALISLLEDPDEEVRVHVRDRLFELGDSVMPVLEDLYLAETDPEQQQRINDIIEQIQFAALKAGLMQWAESGAHDLFEGAYLSCKFRYPDLDRQALNNQLDKMKLDAWLELNFLLSPTDKVRILNYVLFDLHGLKGNTENYHAPDNSFLNRVLETKYGNPVSLAIIYSVIAQRLNIPIFGVNLPQHFIVAYKDDTELQSIGFPGNVYMDYDMPGEVLFYLNPFNRGALFSKGNIDQFLKQLGIKPTDFYYYPCPNVDIIIRVFRNLTMSYEKMGDTAKVEKLKELIELLQPYSKML